MSREAKTKAQLLEEIHELEARLEEAEEALQAIRNGEVDAIYVEGPEGDKVFTLKGADETYRTLIEDMHEGAVTTTTDGIILYANKAFAELIKTPHGHIVGSFIAQYISPENQPMFEGLFQRGVEKPARMEIALNVGKGSQVPAYISINAVSVEGEQIICVTVTDLTEQKRQEEIVKSERLSRAILEAAGEAVLVCDHDGMIIRVNHAARGLVGNPLLFKSFDDTFQLQEISKTIDEASKPFSISLVLRGNSFHGVEVLLRKGNEDEQYLLLSATPLRGEGGIIGCVLVLTDMTDLKKLERELAAERERLSVTLLSIGDGVIVTDLDGRIQLINRVAESLTGWSQNEAGGRPLQEVFHIVNEKTWEPCKNPIDNVLESGQIVGLANDTVLISRDGTERAIADSGSPIMSRDGAIIGVVLVFRDITERRQSEEALQRAHEELEERVKDRTAELSAANARIKKEMEKRSLAQMALKQSEERYRELWEHAPAAYHTVDLNGVITQANQTELDMLGYPRDEIVGRPVFDFVDPEQRNDAEVRFRLKLTGEKIQKHNNRTYLKKDGSKVIVSIDDILELDKDGNVVGVRSTMVDITELKRAQQKLRRLAGQLISVQEIERKRISRELHDSIGQSLAAVKFGLENLFSKLDLGREKEKLKILESLISLVQRGSEDVRRMHTDLRPSLLDDLGILPTIRWFCSEFEKVHSVIRVERNIAIEETDVDESLKLVIFRILQEALNNVAKYSQADLVTVSLKKANKRLDLVIDDNGKGFDPGSISARQLAGGGFGLTNMRERAELSGGSFSIESSPGTGTCVRASWCC